MRRNGKLTQPRSTKPPAGRPHASHSLVLSKESCAAGLPFSAALEGYISFHSSIKNAAIATSCPPQSEISVGCPLDGRGTIGAFRSRFRGDVGAADIGEMAPFAKDTGEREVGRGGSCGKLGSVLNFGVSPRDRACRPTKQ